VETRKWNSRREPERHGHTQKNEWRIQYVCHNIAEAKAKILKSENTGLIGSCGKEVRQLACPWSGSITIFFDSLEKRCRCRRVEDEIFKEAEKIEAITSQNKVSSLPSPLHRLGKDLL
jgi:hypothetical protein